MSCTLSVLIELVASAIVSIIACGSDGLALNMTCLILWTHFCKKSGVHCMLNLRIGNFLYNYYSL